MKDEFLDNIIKWTISIFSILMCMIFGWAWTEGQPTSQSKLELDIKMITPATDRLEDIDPNNYYFKKEVYRYEDDKILIHSSFNNRDFGFTDREDDRFDRWKDPYDRSAKFLGKYGDINVWLKPSMTLVYHSEINEHGGWSSIRDKDKFRSNVTYRKGKWIGYIKELAKQQRKKFYDDGEGYRIREAKEDKERKAYNKAYKYKIKAEEKALKAEKKKSRQKENQRYKEANRPVDDSKLFGENNERNKNKD